MYLSWIMRQPVYYIGTVNYVKLYSEIFLYFEQMFQLRINIIA